MKKLLISLPILFIVTLVFANTFLAGMRTVTVNKQISLSVFTNNDYSAAVYDSSLAQVTITVKKVSGNSSTTVLSKTFDAAQLKKYASVKHAADEILNIAAVKEDRESLVVTYTITYNTKGSIITFEKAERIERGVNDKHIDIEI